MDLAQHNTIPGDRIAVITTKPLTDETGWKEFQRGELLMFDKGKPYSDPDMCASVEQQGRGLFSKSIKKMNVETIVVEILFHIYKVISYLAIFPLDDRSHRCIRQLTQKKRHQVDPMH
eukprot:CAMPEP_0178895756 /NCGR_PEP_ID=MMETSP0786-20121207/766_1 /TAXON_ID=186022 /ORGANISM="Thalassionema frauenfeldii, Strain CCMP 1798" /LENGTH=117 /DNA_ID=CAMNT_0020566027 /DNA_START=505 /DNA_END=861 /DNA_ORIENTATION=+